MTYAINQLKTGVTIAIDKDVFVIVGIDHVKPGKGAAFARVKLRNLRLGTVIERTYKTDDKIEEAFIEEKQLQYSYKDATNYHFLDQETFEDYVISEERLGDMKNFLKDNLALSAYFHGNELVNVALPNFVTYKIIHTEPGIKGDTAKGTNKPATIEGGATIQVPLFVNEGDRVKIDTRTGEYIERSNEAQSYGTK